ncbi:MAG: glycoside hydrolase family 32 protein [Clostridia bacterium]|nr:glycoside hydrolase family 32 protein [Clostridia bacterium]
MKKLFKNAFLTVLFAILVASVAIFAVGSTVKVIADDVLLESGGDTFYLSDVEYGASDKFVYTAVANFVSGNAAGLVFGGKEGESYFVFNTDRNENRVKLIYFSVNDGVTTAHELLTDYFIGNDEMTESERNFVYPKVRSVEKVQLKVVITPENGSVYAEFYADNIRRFGVDNVIDLNTFKVDGVTGNLYDGGYIGYNCFAAKVTFTDVYYGVSDYSYYTEIYRQQYHFSQYAHWNNDPNGLVYYDGWYHLYYQHHPFSNYWSDMYWGHARSRDLVHWELLPICLFPDSEMGEGTGLMWSGSAFVYHKGDSALIDSFDWYPEGKGTGLIAYFTRDGGKQDQVIMSSDDGGMTWIKRETISQLTATAHDGYYGKVDCRDPKIFTVLSENGKTTLWGMVLSGKTVNKIWFLKSSDLINWEYAGGFSASLPECPDLVRLTADDGTQHTVMTFTGRTYIVGELIYDNGTISFVDKNGGQITDDDFQIMDYGPDSYATQTYYIDDDGGDYYGKTVSVSWFAGVPDTTDSGVYALARKVWNGGGMTIPVEWGLKTSGNGYLLTQKPITVSSDDFDKETVVSVNNKALNAGGENILKDINCQTYELSATFENPSREDIVFTLNADEDYYLEVGWNKTEGYYVSRKNASSAGLYIKDFPFKYVSGATAGTTQTFYILSDNGGVEVFCDDFSVPFYVLTLASPYATNNVLSVGGQVTATVKVNTIASVWRKDVAANESVLYLNESELYLDMTITKERNVMAYSTSSADVEWSIVSGSEVVGLKKSASGAVVTAKAGGVAVVEARCGNAVKQVKVSVHSGTADSDLNFSSDDIVSGQWYVTDDGIVGEMASGDGYILSDETGRDFTLSATFRLEAVAAAMILRANGDMSNYIIVNCDIEARLVKVWSANGQIASAPAGNIDTSSITIRSKLIGDELTVYLNGEQKIFVVLSENEPKEGKFGLNVFSGKASFASIAFVKEEYDYEGEDLVAVGDADQAIRQLYNLTLRNVKINPEYYRSEGRKLIISEKYFENLPVGVYTFKAVGGKTSYSFTVNVETVAETEIPDVRVSSGLNATIYVGNVNVVSVSVNGRELTSDQYTCKNKVLYINKEVLTSGENVVCLNGNRTVKVTVVG